MLKRTGSGAGVGGGCLGELGADERFGLRHGESKELD